MNIEPMWLALGAAAILAVIGLIAFGTRKARSSSLRQKFGSEYDHAVKEKGWKTGERELAERAHEIDQIPIRALTADERDRFRHDWARVEQRFVERPTTAVVEADEMVAEVMRLAGYPMGDFEKHVGHLAVTHPRIVHHYRAGHTVIGSAAGSASTEDLRQAMLHYRSLFEELLGAKETDIERPLHLESEVASPRALPRETADRETPLRIEE